MTTLREYLTPYENNENVVLGRGDYPVDIYGALHLGGLTEKVLDSQIKVVTPEENPTYRFIWLLDTIDKSNPSPNFILGGLPVTKKRGRPAQDKERMTFTLDRDVVETIAQIPEGDRSVEVNKKLRSAFGLEIATTPSFNRGDRVEDVSGYYGAGTVRYLNGDLMPDGSGRHYDWPDQVCVEFDREIDGEKPCFWCKPEELRKVSA